MSETNAVSQRTFRDMNLSSWLVQQCAMLGIQHPTPVQQHCIPKILEGHDCIGESQTGTGKTLAFALPILQEFSKDPYGIFSVVITPTRELAYQIAQQFRALGEPILLKVVLVIGGVDMIFQAKELSSRPHIVVATPGRLVDHLENDKGPLFKRIKFLVLDETDRLLEGNFVQQLRTIFSIFPKKRQTLLFSATVSKTLEKLKTVTSHPFTWSSVKSSVTVEKLKQYIILTSVAMKDAQMIHAIQEFQEKHPESLIMVFSKTCKLCQILSVALNKLGFTNVALHSMISQKERFASLTKFKSGTYKLLIATDVASRGLDIPTVDMVINHNVPSVAEDYVHRVGRTARAERSGSAITFLTTHDIGRLYAIEDLIKTKLSVYPMKDEAFLSIVTQVNTAMREAEITLDENDFSEKKNIYKKKREILEGFVGKSERKQKKKAKRHAKSLKQVSAE